MMVGGFHLKSAPKLSNQWGPPLADTAQDGSYSIKGLPTGNYKIYLEPDWETGYLDQWYNNKSDQDSADYVSVTAPNTVTINVVLVPGGIISGKVTNAAGAGLAGIAVSIFDLNGNVVGSSPGAFTASDGSYTVIGLPTGSYKVAFSAAWWFYYIDQWYNNKSSSASADVISVTTGNTYTVDVTLDPCTANLKSSSAYFGKNGGSATVLIDTDLSCQRKATSNASWITIPIGYDAPGSGPVGYLVAANNTGSTRTGTISIFDQTFTVIQSAQMSPGGEWRDLGTLPGGIASTALSVSADGKVVVGQAYTDSAYVYPGTSHAFRWTADTGMVDLGFLPGSAEAVAYRVSADGSTVVGLAGDASGNSWAFKWTQNSGMTNLGGLPGGSVPGVSSAWANGVSADGSVVVGSASDTAGNQRAFKWSQASGMVDLGTLSNGVSSKALTVSDDGGTIAGVVVDDVGNAHVVRWTQTGITDLGVVPGIQAVSADGSVAVGGLWLNNGKSYHAFRWTPTSGVTDLGGFGDNSEALAVTGDGNVAVGWALDYNRSATATRWSDSMGLQTLAQWLTVNGVDATNSNFYKAYGVSADGNAVVGSLINSHAFIAKINPIVISPSYASFGPSGGTGSIDIIATSGSTAWTATSDHPSWISVTSGSSGSGNGTVQYSVASNTGGVRTGTIRIADQTLTVMQGTTLTQAQIGVFRAGAWYVDRDETFGWSGCGPDGCYAYGMVGDQAVTGDWDGNGIVRMGVFRNGNWYLDYNGDAQWSGCGTTADTDRCYTFGMVGDIPVVGDWSGNGIAKIGVFRNGTWYLDYPGTGSWVGCGAPADPTKDACISYGMAGDIPIAGDWNGNGVAKVGVFRNGTWYLDYPGTGSWVGCGAPADPTKDACIPFGQAGDVPVVGNWNGSADSKAKIGVFRNGIWYLDYPGTGSWVGCGAPANGVADVCAGFGMAGDTPVVLR